MKHIVLFINTLSSGGAEHQLVQLADGLVKRGYKVTIATFGDADDHYSYDSAIQRQRIAPKKANVIKMFSIWCYFLTLKADCVIAFGQRESRYMLEGLSLRPFHKIRCIAGDRNTTYGFPSHTEQILMKHLYKKADFIVPNSQAQLKHIVLSSPGYQNKTVCITNYTNLSSFNVTPLPNGSTTRIGVFARYAHQKNCLLFVEAINTLKQQSKFPFIVEWFGNIRIKGSTNPYYLQVKEKVEEYDLCNEFILHDHVKDVAGCMPLFDAICLPSLYEGFSNSISEAICCGKPCIVSDVADNSVMVHHQENGFLFNPSQLDSIVKAFNDFLCLSVEERNRMSKASRKIAESLFDYERFVSSYVNLIEA